MGVYRTAIVQGLSIEHGRGERRQFSPVKTEVISIPLKDTLYAPASQIREGEHDLRGPLG